MTQKTFIKAYVSTAHGGVTLGFFLDDFMHNFRQDVSFKIRVTDRKNIIIFETSKYCKKYSGFWRDFCVVPGATVEVFE